MAFDAVQFIQGFIKADLKTQNTMFEEFYFKMLEQDQKIIFFNTVEKLVNETKEDDPSYPAIVFLAGCSNFFEHHPKATVARALKLFSQTSQINHPLSLCMHSEVLFEKDDSKHMDKAITLAERAVALDCPFAMVFRGDFHESGSKSQVAKKPAIAMYDRARALGSTYGTYKRAMRHRKDGEDKECQALLQEARQSNNVLAITELGLFKEDEGDFDGATAFYDEAIAKDFDNAFIYKAEILINKGDNEGAIKLLDKVIHCNASVTAKYLRAKIYEQSGDYITAITMYKSCVDSDKHAKSMVALGMINWEGKGVRVNRVHAFTHFKNALLNKYSEGIPKLALGMIAEEEQEYPKACNFYDAAIKENNVEAMVYRARCFLKGYGGPIQKDKAVLLLVEATKHNNAEAMYMHACMIDEDKKSSIVEKKLSKELLDKAIALGHEKALEARARRYAATDLPNEMVRARVLFSLASVDFPKKSIEERGLHELLANGVTEKVSIASLQQMSQAMMFINNLPTSYAKHSEIKQKLLTAIGQLLINQYPIKDKFYEKLSKLDAKKIDSAVYLMNQYGLAKYNNHGQSELRSAISFNNMALSLNPYAFKILEKVAKRFPAHNDYYVALFHFTDFQAPGKLKPGSKDLALKGFKKVLDNPNTPKNIKDLAQEKLNQLNPRAPAASATSSAIMLEEFNKEKPDHSAYVPGDQVKAKETPVSIASVIAKKEPAPTPTTPAHIVGSIFPNIPLLPPEHTNQQQPQQPQQQRVAVPS